jgi:hypothetical protein
MCLFLPADAAKLAASGGNRKRRSRQEDAAMADDAIRPEQIQLRRSAESKMTSSSVAHSAGVVHLCHVFRGPRRRKRRRQQTNLTEGEKAKQDKQTEKMGPEQADGKRRKLLIQRVAPDELHSRPECSDLRPQTRADSPSRQRALMPPRKVKVAALAVGLICMHASVKMNELLNEGRGRAADWRMWKKRDGRHLVRKYGHRSANDLLETERWAQTRIRPLTYRS